MAKKFHRATVSVFLRPDEPASFLDAILPIPVNVFFKEQFYYDENHEKTKVYEIPKAKLKLQNAEGFDSHIAVYTFSFERITNTNTLFEETVKKLSQADQALLQEEALLHVDEHGRFSFRLGLNELKAGKCSLVDKGPSVQLSFLLAAYPKNMKTIRTCVKNLFE